MEVNILKLKEIELSGNVFLKKEEVMNLLGIKKTSYEKIRKEFINLIHQDLYPDSSYFKYGSKELIALYPFLHFINNYERYKDRFLKKKVKVYTKSYIQELKEIGVA